MDAYLERQICARIKQARKEAGFSQEDMAGLLNVTTRAYQNYERNRVPFRRLTEIAKLTKRPEDWLLHGDPQPGEADTGQLQRIEEGLAENAERLERLLAAVAELRRGPARDGEA